MVKRPSPCQTCGVASQFTKEQGPGTSNYTIGQIGGAENITLTSGQIPSHTHQAQCFTGGSNSKSPVNGIWAQASNDQPYKGSETGAANMAPGAIGPAGGNQPHPNLMAYQALNYIIALVGDLPIAELIRAALAPRLGPSPEGMAAEAIGRQRVRGILPA